MKARKGEHTAPTLNAAPDIAENSAINNDAVEQINHAEIPMHYRTLTTFGLSGALFLITCSIAWSQATTPPVADSALLKTCVSPSDRDSKLEAGVGIEPTHRSFAGCWKPVRRFSRCFTASTEAATSQRVARFGGFTGRC